MYRYKENRYMKIKKFFIIFFIVVLTAIASVLIYDMYLNIEITDYSGLNGEIKATRISQTISEEKEEEKTVIDVIDDATDCIVGISKIKNTGNSIFLNGATTEMGIGSGVIVSENGYILTNWHVSGNKYSNCYITLESGKTYTGNVVWSDSDLDLAIVKIPVKGLKYITLGDSDNVKVAQTVYAIGNPIGFEFQRSVTSGIISGVNRTIKIEEDDKSVYMEDLIQTDATINPGNSGGALINLDGEIIGINSVKIESAEGIGFAIPINIVKPIINKFVENGSFEEAYLGIFAYDKEVIPYLDSNINFESGIYVVQISKDGPAAKSNLKTGDIITKIDENKINKMTDLRSYIYTKEPNQEVTLRVLRNNKEYELKIILGRKN